ncbi:DUF6644 family protein [Massilia yuzhufengensis]|uniref:DUF6644 domain-containing protein n=1 Tax=Massilia yuzhufengensis TaxID=1164594 RepID=A0A1I1DFI8_9BURK|nr:DUF6644 family protein [Massilia yuzhufengensis]SFB71293.1 hypothetical protein SAMN05216204_10180 [Massilia yuzhufengensis]
MPWQDAARFAASLPLAQALREHAWLYPIVETLHIVGFAVLVGAVAMFDLRVLGFGRQLPVKALARHLLPWSAGSMLLVVPTGLLLLVADPLALLANRVFLLKLGLILLAGVNALAFHAGPYGQADAWTGRAPPRALLHALLSLGLWIAVIACGRLIAYF